MHHLANCNMSTSLSRKMEVPASVRGSAYSYFASQDLRPSGPNPWKVLAHIVYNNGSYYSITYQQKMPGPTLGQNIVQ